MYNNANLFITSKHLPVNRLTTIGKAYNTHAYLDTDGTQIYRIVKAQAGCTQYALFKKTVPYEQNTYFVIFTFFIFFYWWWGRDSVVGTATRYGLDGPGI